MAMTWFSLPLYISILILCSMIIVVVFFWESSLLFNRAPFIATPREVVSHIISALDLHDDSVVYDLGCGEGRILSACHQAKPKAKLVGVERSWLPYLIARYLTRKLPKDKLRLIRGDLMQTKLTDADRIFVYLFPGFMADVLAKFQRELKPGALVVSGDFEFKGKEPIRVVDLNRPKRKLGRKLFVYQF